VIDEEEQRLGLDREAGEIEDEPYRLLPAKQTESDGCAEDSSENQLSWVPASAKTPMTSGISLSEYD